MTAERGRSGQTYQQWLATAGADFLTGRRSAMPTYVEYLREFIADDEGRVEIRSFVDPASKTEVMLPESVLVPVEEIPRIEAELLAGEQRHVEFLWWSTVQSRGDR